MMLATLTFILAVSGINIGPDLNPTGSPKRPVALALSQEGKRLYVANRQGGSLSVIDTDPGKVAREFPVGEGLADLALLPDNRTLLAVDRAGDALIWVDLAQEPVQIKARLQLAPDPARVLISPDGKACIVASTRSRRLTVVILGDEVPGTLTLARSVALPFSPRNLAWVRPGTKLVVADAFGGQMAVVDFASGLVESSWTLAANNIRGLALAPDGKSIVMAHQTLHRLARSSFEDVHWGSLVSNHLRLIDVDALLDPKARREGRLIELGEAGNGAADPGQVAFGPDGKIIVTLSGVDQIAVDGLNVPRREGVGRKPSAIVVDAHSHRAFVANELDDTISVINVDTAKRVGLIELGSSKTTDPVGRGERLFSDARLSHDGWMSCQSCHTDGQTNGQVADTLSDGSFGAPKRVTTLLGAWSTAPWTWLGNVNKLEDQVRKSVETTMQGKAPTEGQVDDLSAYLRTLDPPPTTRPSKPDLAVYRGWELFRTRGCASCHAPPDYTLPNRYDVALPDELGNRRFNPPSLRDVGNRQPLLHDARAATLPEVFLKYRHPRETEWNREEVLDLVEFLKTL